MNRITASILAVIGLVVMVLGLYPSGLLGRLNGVGSFGGHTTADVMVVVGVVVLAAGIYSVIRRPPA